MCDGEAKVSPEVIEDMRILWNNLSGEQRKALADLMSVRHADYLCTSIRTLAKRCQAKVKK